MSLVSLVAVLYFGVVAVVVASRIFSDGIGSIPADELAGGVAVVIFVALLAVPVLAVLAAPINVALVVILWVARRRTSIGAHRGAASALAAVVWFGCAMTIAVLNFLGADESSSSGSTSRSPAVLVWIFAAVVAGAIFGRLVKLPGDVIADQR